MQEAGRRGGLIRPPGTAKHYEEARKRATAWRAEEAGALARSIHAANETCGIRMVCALVYGLLFFSEFESS